MSYIFAGLIYIPFYVWGIHINREIEVNSAHSVYTVKYQPRRNRLTEALFYEEFEMFLERYKALKPEINELYEQERVEIDEQVEEDDDFSNEDDEDEDEDEDDE